MLAALFVGSVGLGLFLYGKRQGRLPHLLLGLTMLVSTYFVSSVIVMLLMGGGLALLLWALVRLGW